MKKIFTSIIIPVKEINDYLRQETIPALLKQSSRDFEIILLPDKPSQERFPKTKVIATWPKTGPADKRDFGAKKAMGEILAFIDDDSYPVKDWLKESRKIFKKNPKIAAVCGPTLTPGQDNFRQRIGGYVWGSSLGSRGAGFYRYTVSQQQDVDDFPTANLLVRKKDFWQAGGFDTHFWSGEDTKLCWQITKKLKKRIIYHPQILVYHHRREIFKPHLIQIARYGLHRGHFARIMPETSFRLRYFLPSVFVLGLISGPILASFFFYLWYFYFFTLFIYGLWLLGTGIRVLKAEKNLRAFILVMLAIFSTHFIYGLWFIKGFFSKSLEH